MQARARSKLAHIRIRTRRCVTRLTRSCFLALTYGSTRFTSSTRTVGQSTSTQCCPSSTGMPSSNVSPELRSAPLRFSEVELESKPHSSRAALVRYSEPRTEADSFTVEQLEGDRQNARKAYEFKVHQRVPSPS
mmetsp:Transcript_12169/g.32748  ORF Transcript_12169/g.32748 Transcript_12169/m.32748 type:complete len:134 (-) Transcript_12169:12-413(-)